MRLQNSSEHAFQQLGTALGFAYSVNNKTVVRSSYGIFYAHAGGVGGRTNGRQGLSQIGFDNSGSLTSTATGRGLFIASRGHQPE